jgi:hypothetical protein
MPNDLWDRLKDIASRTAKAVLAFQLPEDGELNLQTKTDMRTLILSLRQFGQDNAATCLALEYDAFVHAVLYRLHGEAIYANESGEEAHDRLSRDQPEPDPEDARSALAARLRSLELLEPAGTKSQTVVQALGYLLTAIEKHRLTFLFFALPKRLKGKNVGWETLYRDDLPRSRITTDDIDAEGEFLFRHRFALDQFAQTAIGAFGPGEGFKPHELTSDGKWIDVDGSGFPVWSFDELACVYLEKTSDALFTACNPVALNDPRRQFRQLLAKVAAAAHDSRQPKWYSSMLVSWGYLAQLDEAILAVKRALAGVYDDGEAVADVNPSSVAPAAGFEDTKGPNVPHYLLSADPAFAFSDCPKAKDGFGSVIYRIADESTASLLIKLYERQYGREPFPLAACSAGDFDKESYVELASQMSRLESIVDALGSDQHTSDPVFEAMAVCAKRLSELEGRIVAGRALADMDGWNGPESNPDFIRSLSIAIAAAVGVNELDRIKLLYPNSVDLNEITLLRKTLSDWITITLAGQDFEQVKKTVSDPVRKEFSDAVLPGLLSMFHPGVKVTGDMAETHECIGAVVLEGQKQSPPIVAEALARISQIQISDCRMPNPANDKIYQEPKRLLMVLQHYWRLCRQLVLDETDANIGFQPHPLLPLIVNAKLRIETCFAGLSSLQNASEAQKTAVGLIELLLTGESDDLSAAPEWTIGEIAKVDMFLAEAQLSLGSASYDLTNAEQAFIKVFEQAAAEYQNRRKKTWNGMLSKMDAEAQKRKQVGKEVAAGQHAVAPHVLQVPISQEAKQPSEPAGTMPKADNTGRPLESVDGGATGGGTNEVTKHKGKPGRKLLTKKDPSRYKQYICWKKEWDTGKHKTYADCAADFGTSVTAKDIENAVGYLRKHPPKRK